jgi:hypothetical protein
MMRAALVLRSKRARLVAVVPTGRLRRNQIRGRLVVGEEPRPMLMSPENYVQVYRGSSATLTLTVGNEDGTAMDLTGCRVLFTVKKTAEDRSPLIQKTSAVPEQVQVAGRAARMGVATIYLTPPDTAHLEPGKYVFDVWVVLPGEGGARLVAIPPSDFEVVRGITVLL